MALQDTLDYLKTASDCTTAIAGANPISAWFCYKDMTSASEKALNGLFSLILSFLQLLGQLCVDAVSWLFSLRLTESNTDLQGNSLPAFIDLNNGIAKMVLDNINEIVAGIFLLAILFFSFQLITRMGDANLKKTLTLVITSFVLAMFAPRIAIMLINLGTDLTDSMLGGLGGSFAFIKEALGQYQGLVAYNLASTEGPAELAGLIIAVLFQVVTIATLIKLLLMLAERIIRLIYLTIISPFYFAVGILPNKELQGYRSQWWSELIRWIVALPFAAVILQISTSLLSQLNQTNANQPGSISEVLIPWAMATAGMLFAGNIPQILKLPMSAASQAVTKSLNPIGWATAGGAMAGQSLYKGTLGVPLGYGKNALTAAGLSLQEGLVKMTDPARQRFNNGTLGRWLATPEAIIKQREAERAAREKRAENPLKQATTNRQRAVGRLANNAIGNEAFRNLAAADLTAINAQIAADAIAAGVAVPPPATSFAQLSQISPNAAYDLIHNHPTGGAAQRALARRGNRAVLAADAFQGDRLKDISEKANEQARDLTIGELTGRFNGLRGNNNAITDDHLIALKALDMKRRKGTKEERDAAEIAYADMMNEFRGRITNDKPLKLSLPRTNPLHPARTGHAGTNPTRVAAAAVAMTAGTPTTPGVHFHPTAGGPGRSTGPIAQAPAQPGGPLDHWAMIQAERQVDRFTQDLQQLDSRVAAYQSTINQLTGELQTIEATATTDPQLTDIVALSGVSSASTHGLNDNRVRQNIVAQQVKDGGQNLRTVASQMQAKLDDIWQKYGDNQGLRESLIATELKNNNITDHSELASVLATVRTPDLNTVASVAVNMANGNTNTATQDYIAKRSQLHLAEAKVATENSKRSTLELNLKQATNGVASLGAQLATQASNNPAFATLVSGYTQRGGNRAALASETQQLLQETRAAIRQNGHSLRNTQTSALDPALQQRWARVINSVGITDFRGVDNLSNRYRELKLTDLMDLGAYTNGSAR